MSHRQDVQYAAYALYLGFEVVLPLGGFNKGIPVGDLTFRKKPYHVFPTERGWRVAKEVPSTRKWDTQFMWVKVQDSDFFGSVKNALEEAARRHSQNSTNGATS